MHFSVYENRRYISHRPTKYNWTGRTQKILGITNKRNRMGNISNFEIQCSICQPFDPRFKIPLHCNESIGFLDPSEYQRNFEIYFKNVFAW